MEKLSNGDDFTSADFTLAIAQKMFGIGSTALLGRRRMEEYNRIRYMTYHILYDIYKYRITTIANYFNRNHATIIHGLDQHLFMYNQDYKDYKRDFDLYKNYILQSIKKEHENKYSIVHNLINRLRLLEMEALSIRKELTDSFKWEIETLGLLDK